MATIARMTHDPDTRTYVEKRRAEGRTTKEIRRILKSYLADQVYCPPAETAASHPTWLDRHRETNCDEPYSLCSGRGWRSLVPHHGAWRRNRSGTS